MASCVLTNNLRILSRRFHNASSSLNIVNTSSVRGYMTVGDKSAYEALMKTDANKILYFTASWCPPVSIFY